MVPLKRMRGSRPDPSTGPVAPSRPARPVAGLPWLVLLLSLAIGLAIGLMTGLAMAGRGAPAVHGGAWEPGGVTSWPVWFALVGGLAAVALWLAGGNRAEARRMTRDLAIACDITETHALQDQLKARAERYDLAIDGGNDGLWDWMDVKAKEEWWSPQFYRLLGYEPDEIPASVATVDAMLHPDDRAMVRDATRRALRERTPLDVECRLRTRSRHYRWFRARAKVYCDERGEATRMAGSIQDLHDRKEAQARLRVQGQQTEAIFSLSPDGFVAFDVRGRVSYVSPAFTRLTGLSGDAVKGLDEAVFGELLFKRATCAQPVEGLADVRRLLNEPGRAPRVLIEMKPPGLRTLELRLSEGEAGAVSRVLHLRDVTHETELDRMKSAFLSMAAHELRTPITSIYGFTELLMTRAMPEGRQRDVQGRIHRHAEAMIGIVDELLDLARMEAHHGRDFAFDTCDLGTLISGLIVDFKLPAARQAPLFALPEAGVRVWADARKLRQAVLNVLSNAYKYSPQGGDVCLDIVTNETHPGQAGVRIRDAGIGLSPEQAARVGERFYRADTSGAIPGTGLGMTIVKEILTVMGGTLVLASEPGKGTCVTLWLPRMADAAGPAATASTRNVTDVTPKSAQKRDAPVQADVTEFSEGLTPTQHG